MSYFHTKQSLTPKARLRDIQPDGAPGRRFICAGLPMSPVSWRIGDHAKAFEGLKIDLADVIRLAANIKWRCNLTQGDVLGHHLAQKGRHSMRDAIVRAFNTATPGLGQVA